jgi:rhamnogalacturonyl hydrolase YesR
MDALSPDDLRFMIGSATSDGDSLDAIERDMIDPAPFTDDAKSGLWLYAWSGAGLRRGRRPAPAREALLQHG